MLRDDMREVLTSIFLAGVEAASPRRAVRGAVRREDHRLRVCGTDYDLGGFRHIYVIAAGKGAAPMAGGIEEILGDRITAGLAVVPYGYGGELEKIEIVEASHPLPDREGLKAAARVLKIAKGADKDDLVLCLISGGSSSLLASPVDGITLDDKVRLTGTLLRCGARIGQINTVRKHLSKIKGGRLAEAVHPAGLITLVISDVVGGDLSTIGSGPTVPDATTFAEAEELLRRYGIEKMVPDSVLRYLESGKAGLVSETPKPGSPVFADTQAAVIAGNRKALLAAKEKAEEYGYNTLLLSSMIEGEASVVAGVHGAIVREIRMYGTPVRPPACIISGGETTVTVRGGGIGGRNQEFALALAINIEGVDGVYALSGGTDGCDGPTDAAGGIVDGTTVRRARKMGLDLDSHIRNNDSYTLLKGVGNLLVTGPTRTNVMDIRIVVVE